MKTRDDGEDTFQLSIPMTPARTERLWLASSSDVFCSKAGEATLPARDSRFSSGQ